MAAANIIPLDNVDPALVEALLDRAFEPERHTRTAYKVRVGMNMQRQEADKVMRRLQNEEKFKPWITR
jgi:hypothetical protein